MQYATFSRFCKVCNTHAAVNEQVCQCFMFQYHKVYIDWWTYIMAWFVTTMDSWYIAVNYEETALFRGTITSTRVLSATRWLPEYVWRTVRHKGKRRFSSLLNSLQTYVFKGRLE